MTWDDEKPGIWQAPQTVFVIVAVAWVVGMLFVAGVIVMGALL